MKAIEKYEKRATKINSLLSVGLDPEFEKIPERFKQMGFPQFEFNKFVIEETHEFAAAYKPNAAFYEARGDQGWRELAMTVAYLREQHPDIFTIFDAKRADIGSTNEQYAKAIFDELGFDAVTLHPYFGAEALEPFLRRDDKASIILCRTSNKGAGEFQDLVSGERPLWQIVAERVSREWNHRGNCMLVVGATYPKELRAIRGVVGEMTLLVPGIGTQGGSVKDAVEGGVNSEKLGLIIHSSKSVIFSEDPAGAAGDLRDEINRYR